MRSSTVRILFKTSSQANTFILLGTLIKLPFLGKLDYANLTVNIRADAQLQIAPSCTCTVASPLLEVTTHDKL